MIRALLRFALPILLGAAATPVFAQMAKCDQADLDHIAAAYLAAQTSGDTLKLPFADFTSYSEQGQDASTATGVLGSPLKVAWSHVFTDLRACQSFVEVISADPARPLVTATRLQFSGQDNPIAPSRVNGIDTVIAKPGDPRFDAAGRLRAAKAEAWTPIATTDRDTRDALLGAANAYLDWLGSRSGTPPLAAGCQRLEGGAVAACDAAPAMPVKLTERAFVVDEGQGAVAVTAIGLAKLPAVHVLRIEKGRIRSIDVLAACTSATTCALP